MPVFLCTCGLRAPRGVRRSCKATFHQAVATSFLWTVWVSQSTLHLAFQFVPFFFFSGHPTEPSHTTCVSLNPIFGHTWQQKMLPGSHQVVVRPGTSFFGQPEQLRWSGKARQLQFDSAFPTRDSSACFIVPNATFESNSKLKTLLIARVKLV